jgi:hypothetical protein
MDEAAASTLKRAEEAMSQIPADFKEGTSPPAFAAARAEMGDWTGAAEYAKGLEKPFARTSAFSALALAEQRHGRDADAKSHFALAIEAANAEEVARRSVMLSIVARAQARAGLPDAAETFDLAIAADKLTGKGPPRAIVYQRIRAGEFDRAYVDISDFPADDRDRYLQQLVNGLARAGRIDQGAAIAATIGNDDRDVEAWTDLATADFRAGRSFEGAQKLVKAAAIGKAESVEASRVEATARVAGAEAVGGMTERAKAHFAEVRAALAAEADNTFKESISGALALALARAGETDAALDALGAVEARFRAAPLVNMAEDLEAAHRPGEAYAVLEALPDDIRAFQLLELAERLPN